MKNFGIKWHFAFVKNLCKNAGKYFTLFALLENTQDWSFLTLTSNLASFAFNLKSRILVGLSVTIRSGLQTQLIFI